MLNAMKRKAGAALCTGTLALAACDLDRPKPEPPATTAAVTAPGAGVEAIKDAPERYYGKTVHVSGKIDQAYNDRAFDLEGAGWAFNDNITVLTRSPVRMGGSPLERNDEVVVTGTVRPFVVAEVERDIGWDIGPDVEVKLTKRPVLIASRIRKVDEYGQWPAPAANEPVTTTLAIVTTADAAELSGRKVDLARERVHAVTGKGLWVGPTGMSQVFVLPRDPVKDIQPGDWVRVSGTLQKAPNDAVKAWDLPANMAGVVWEQMAFIDGATVTEVGAGTK